MTKKQIKPTPPAPPAESRVSPDPDPPLSLRDQAFLLVAKAIFEDHRGLEPGEGLKLARNLVTVLLDAAAEHAIAVINQRERDAITQASQEWGGQR